MITRNEILKGRELNSEHKANFEMLLMKINSFRKFYGKPMIITSGYRTIQDQQRIYAEKGILDIDKIPMGSKHLSAQALDVYDSSGELKNFILDNVENNIIREFWFEDFKYTKEWVHFQITPPRSRKRFFIP